MPKSGTTLSVSLLDGISGISVLPFETELRTRFERTSASLARHALLDPEEGLLFKRLVSRLEGLALTPFDEIAMRAQASLRDAYLATYAAESTSHLLEIVGETWSNEWGEGAPTHFVEKTPGNEFSWRGEKRRALHVYVVRHPVQNFASLRAKYPRLSVEEFTFRWMRSVRVAAGARAEDSRTIFVRYEDVTVDPANFICQTLGLCGLRVPSRLDVLPTFMGRQWPGNSLFGENGVGVRQTSSRLRFASLTKDEICKVEGYLFREMLRLDYEPLCARRQLRNPYFWLQAPRNFVLRRMRVGTNSGINASMTTNSSPKDTHK